MPCVAEQSVLDLLGGHLPEEEIARAESHLATCTSCQDLLGVPSERMPISSRVSTVAGYVLKERIGRGGAGTVYRAARPGEPEVALKTVKTGSASAVVSLRNEIRVLRRVHHPGVVDIVDEGVEAGMPWLAMELVKGERLDALLRERSGTARRPVDRSLLTILRRVAETLAYLHGRGLVHRDLSPHNIMVRDGHPVLIDFGFASIAYEESRRRIDDSTAGLGTMPYLAPEQIRGEELDARTDLYALGCLLFEALTGRPPFVGGPQEVVRAHLTAQPVAPSQLAPGVPPELDATVLQLLAKDRSMRIGYALDVVDRLALLGAEGFAGATEVPRTYLYACSLVGRSELVARLDALLSDASNGAGSFVCLSGESGVGKTRLLAEAARVARQLGMTVVSGRCVSVDLEGQKVDPSSGPLHPLRSLLQLAADRCRDGGRAEVAHLFGAARPLVADHDSTLRQVVQQVVGDTVDPPACSPEGVREQILAEARHLLRALALRAPLLLLFDDLQWADELSLALLETLRRDFVGTLPLAVVGAYRTDEMRRDRLEALRAVGTTLDVARLDRDSAERIAREMLGSPEAPGSILHDVLSDAQGNPFFLTEYMRTAMAQGWLRRGRLGGWTLQAPGRDALIVAQRLPLPQSVKILFERRLADLGEDARKVLLAVAVIGAEVPLCCLVGVVAEIPSVRFFESLDLLCERQILRNGPEGYAFTHDKLRETLYDLTPEAERRHVHLRAAVYLEEHRTQAPKHAPISDEALAHHFAAGGQPIRALDYLDRAGDVAFRSGAHEAAVEIFGRALSLAGPAEDAASKRRSAGWRQKRGDARFAIGDVDGCIEDSRAALELLGHPVPTTKLGWVLRVVTGFAMVLASGLWMRMRAPRPRRADRLEVARCAGQLASSYYFTLSLTEMLAVLLWGLLWARRSARPELVVEAQARLAYVAGVAGVRTLARSLFAGAQQLARPREHRAGARAVPAGALRAGPRRVGRCDRLGARGGRGAARGGRPAGRRDRADRGGPRGVLPR
jgi:predicted Ser/Thr protein kinase